MKPITVDLPKCGKIKVYVQGERRPGKIGILTVHDVGQNHKIFLPFVESYCMQEICKRCVWIHLCLPGQEEGAENLPDDFVFPTLDDIADDIVLLLNQHNIASVLGLGVGAGANILYRFGLRNPTRCTGLILINCHNSDIKKRTTRHTSLLPSKLKEKLWRMKRKHSIHHDNLHPDLNPHNVECFAENFTYRSDLSSLVKQNKLLSVLLIAGQFSKHVDFVKDFVSLNVLQQLLVTFDTICPLEDKHEDLARAMILFCKGCGILLDVPMLGLEKDFNRVRHLQSANPIQLQIAKRMQHYENLLEKEQ